MQQLIADLTAKANKAEAEVYNKQADIESRERIEALKARVELLKIGIKEDATDSRLAFQQELNYTQLKQQGAPNIPEQGDTLVLSGVNDPITEEQNPQADDDLTPEEQQALLEKLQNFTPNTTRM